MASTIALRRVALNASRSSRSFHASTRSFIKVGDKLPNLDVLVENSPGNKVNLSEAIKGKALIIGVPAAFSELQFCFPEMKLNRKSKMLECQLLTLICRPFMLKLSCPRLHQPQEPEERR